MSVSAQTWNWGERWVDSPGRWGTSQAGLWLHAVTLVFKIERSLSMSFLTQQW